MNLAFNSPWFLALLAVIPVLWFTGRRSLSGMGRTRAVVAMTVRSLLVVLLVLALAEAQSKRFGQGVAVMYVLDQSLSIPNEQRQAMFNYVSQAVEQHRDEGRGDRAGVIVFGREAAIEVPPIKDDLGWLRRSEVQLPHLAEATDLSAALQLAISVFPADSARRIVIVSDGNENLGAARDMLPRLEKEGIGVDVAPVVLGEQPDIWVEKITLPPVPRQGERVEARVVIVNDDNSGPVRGRLQVSRRLGEDFALMLEEEVVLQPGKNVFPLEHTLDVPPGFYTYEARFIPDDAATDSLSKNNSVTAFAHVRGRGRVLLIENVDTPHEFEFLAERLRQAELIVEVRDTSNPFASLADLQTYDCVIMANAPRISGPNAEFGFRDDQIAALVRNTEMGCGLVMLGGPNSFGAGGWANTPLEEVSPVNFTIDNAKVVPIGALALVVDKSGSMQGEKMVMCRQAAYEALRVLGPQDYFGVVAFDDGVNWQAPMQQVGPNRQAVAQRLRRLGADGGTNMFPAMQQAASELIAAPAAAKHMIVLGDGQTPPADFLGLARSMRQRNISVSAVAVGTDADRRLLADIARVGGGKFYQVTSPQAIPRIFTIEAMRVSRPLVYERAEGFTPQIVRRHEILRGIEGPLPPITGFVMTSVKSSPLVEVAIRSPQPAEDDQTTVLASWQYSLGRVAVITTDAGQRWAKDWEQWQNYDALYEQVVRWAMRPRGGEENFLVTTELRDGEMAVVITAMNDEGDYQNLLGMEGAVTLPSLETVSLPINQTAPGRYEGSLPVDTPGSYFLTINPGTGGGAIRAGVSVPYSAEFNDRETNWPLLEALAGSQPAGGETGQLLSGNVRQPAASGLLAIDTFRATLAQAISLRDIWPLLVLLAACLLFFDVLIRRVAINPLEAVRFVAAPALGWLGRGKPAAPEERMQRLRASKQEISRSLEAQRAAVRFEAPAETASDEAPASDLLTQAAPAPRENPQPGGGVAATETEELDYTSRLLAAKRQQRQKHQPREL